MRTKIKSESCDTEKHHTSSVTFVPATFIKIFWHFVSTFPKKVFKILARQNKKGCEASGVENRRQQVDYQGHPTDDKA